MSFLSCQVFKCIALGFPFPPFLVGFNSILLILLGIREGKPWGAILTLLCVESPPYCLLEDAQQRFLSSLGTEMVELPGKQSVFILWISRTE